MRNPIQLSLLEDFDLHNSKPKEIDDDKVMDLGTFKDSLKAPIHNWFRYPAGYSYKLVNTLINSNDLHKSNWVYDPFSGSGTTILTAKEAGVNGYGVEAHSFVHWVANVKVFWDFDLLHLLREIEVFLRKVKFNISRDIENIDIGTSFPELIYKCYNKHDLKELYIIRQSIINEVEDEHFRDLLKLALTDTLRGSAVAGTGWPYISPKNNVEGSKPKKALVVFEKAIRKMYSDLTKVISNVTNVATLNVLGDSRTQQQLDNNSISLAITSPPYLNNYDYADRTRLETYFWGLVKDWKGITQNYRNKLMVAATTQIVRSQYEVDKTLNLEIFDLAPITYRFLQDAVLQLSDLRKIKGGKKDYDLMVALYFNDILEVLRETLRVLKPGAKFSLVLGDSAPYGVHIPTEKIIGDLGVALGFRSYDYREFRIRGNKWKANPQRHTVQLKEGMITLVK